MPVTVEEHRCLCQLKILTLKGAMYGSLRQNLDFPKPCDLHLDGRLEIGQLMSRTWTLDESNETFAAMRGGRVARGVVVFN